MKTINYGGRDLQIGSIAEENAKVVSHMEALAYYKSSSVEDVDTEWYRRFNSQPAEMDNFRNLSKDKKTFLDIGSQFGSFSYFFLGDSKDKTAYAFDGGLNPYLITTQIKFINKLDNLHTFNFLIGNKNEIVKCHSEELQSLALQGSDSRLMLSIDMICQLYNIQPDTLKIDIEGSEYQALVGGYDTIMEYRPIIFAEIHPQFLKMYGSSIEDIANYVKQIDYKVLDLNQVEVEDYLGTLAKELTDSNRSIWVPN